MLRTEFWKPYNIKVKESEGANHEEASFLQKQLGDMEGEVKEIQMELAAIRRDRQNLQTNKIKSDLEPDSHENSNGDEKFNMFSEASKLREELILAKNSADEERFQREQYERKLKDLETKLNLICSPGIVNDEKELHIVPEPDVSSMKTEIRDLKEELEETRLTIIEKNEQIQDYRVKYLQAQQQVEELKRQLDVVDFDNKQVSDQIQIEIQNMKMQFQEKLQELAPLPDLLKGAQIQLQEAKQFQKLAESNSQQLSLELQRVRDKLVLAVNGLNQEKGEKSQIQEENRNLKSTVKDNQAEIGDLTKQLDEQKSTSFRLQEKLNQLELRFKEKAKECAVLLKEVDELKQDLTRSIGRNKERADSMKKYLQAQISELERQLVQSRAQCRACQKERDEIRQRMNIQINNLQENFELVEIRLRALQGQVNSLKNSYSIIISDEEDSFAEYNKIATQ